MFQWWLVAEDTWLLLKLEAKQGRVFTHAREMSNKKEENRHQGREEEKVLQMQLET